MGPEDVIFVLVAAPVLVWGGSAASAVLREVGGGIDVTGEEKEGGPENSSATLPRVLLEESGTFIIEGLDRSSGDGYGISFPIDIDAETVREIVDLARNTTSSSHITATVSKMGTVVITTYETLRSV